MSRRGKRRKTSSELAPSKAAPVGSQWRSWKSRTWVALGGILSAVIAGVIVEWWARHYEPRLSQTAEIKRLVDDEARFSLQAPGAAEQYIQLFSNDAQVEDARGTEPAAVGREAIVKRFRGLPKFAVLSHDLVAPPVFQNAGSVATAETISTIAFGDVRRTGSEKWWFTKADGRWKIHALRYNLPGVD